MELFNLYFYAITINNKQTNENHVLYLFKFTANNIYRSYFISIYYLKHFFSL
jgi:hypothetical protein